jgi:hypothetical protein
MVRVKDGSVAVNLTQLPIESTYSVLTPYRERIADQTQWARFGRYNLTTLTHGHTMQINKRNR